MTAIEGKWHSAVLTSGVFFTQSVRKWKYMIAKLIAVHGVSFQLTLVMKGWNVPNLTIFKVGAQEESTNYRPVNLMMQMGKMTAGKAESANSGHSNTHCKEERLSISHTVKRDVCPFLPALSQVYGYVIFTYPILCLTVGKIHLLFNCN